MYGKVKRYFFINLQLLEWLLNTCNNLNENNYDDNILIAFTAHSFNTLNPSDYLDAIPRVGLEWFMNEEINRNLQILGNVDPHSNLFEIFLRTLLPWNYLDTSEIDNHRDDENNEE